jgi:hypothetical protein
MGIKCWEAILILASHSSKYKSFLLMLYGGFHTVRVSNPVSSFFILPSVLLTAALQSSSLYFMVLSLISVA